MKSLVQMLISGLGCHFIRSSQMVGDGVTGLLVGSKVGLAVGAQSSL